MVRAMQDHFVTPLGQARPAIWNVQDVIWSGSLKPAWAERTQSIRKIRPALSPWSDNYVGTCQRVDTEISVAHESSPDAGAGNTRPTGAGHAPATSARPSQTSRPHSPITRTAPHRLLHPPGCRLAGRPRRMTTRSGPQQKPQDLPWAGCGSHRPVSRSSFGLNPGQARVLGDGLDGQVCVVLMRVSLRTAMGSCGQGRWRGDGVNG